MTNTLKLVLTDHWFEEIKSGRKTHEYRRKTDYWLKRLTRTNELGELMFKYDYVQFQKAYRKNPERMTFEIKCVVIVPGKNTDLHCNEPVFDILLGERI